MQGRQQLSVVFMSGFHLYGSLLGSHKCYLSISQIKEISLRSPFCICHIHQLPAFFESKAPTNTNKPHLFPPETHVLFELIAHRYETGSMIITANHSFNNWDQIFSDTTMTVAAIDRLVHHASIIEIDADSFRKKEAMARNQKLSQTRLTQDSATKSLQ